MKKRLLITIGVLVCLVAGFIAALPALVNLHAVKARAISVLSKATGRKVSIEHLRLALFPWIGVRIDGATIANGSGFGHSPFATVDDAVVEVKLLPLLSHRLVIRRVVLTDLTLNLETRGHGLDNWRFGAHPKPSAHRAVPARTASAPVFHLLRAAGISVDNATIHYTDLATHARYALTGVSLHTGAIAPDTPVHVVADGRIHVPQTTMPFTLDVRARAAGDSYTLSPFHFSLGSLTLNGAVDATNAANGWTAHGVLRVPRFAPRPFLAALHVAYAPQSPKALQALSARARFSYDSHGLLLAPLTVHLDKTRMTGRLGMRTQPRRYRAQLTIDHIAPARYLPAKPAPTSAPASPQPPSPKQPAGPSPLAALNLRATLDVDTLLWHRVTLTAVSLPLVVSHGDIVMDPIHADLYGGTFAGAIHANQAQPTPTVAVDGQLLHVRVGPLLQAVRLSSSFSGILHGRVNVHARGRTSKAIERTLSGHARIAIAHGALRGLDLDMIAADPRVAAGSHRLKKVVGTAFQHLRASAVLVDGVAHTRDLTIQTARATIHGQGTISLPGRSLDYLLQVSLPSGFTVPVSLKGPFAHVQFGIAVRRLLGERGAQKTLHSTVRHIGHALQNFFGIH